MKQRTRHTISRRSAVGAGLGGAAAAALGGVLTTSATAQTSLSPPLEGKFASNLYMQFPAGEPVPTSIEAQGYRFPVEWYDTQGRAYTAADLKGRMTLIQFWRTRCPACQVEVPAFDALARELEGPRFRIIAIAIMEDSLNDIQRFYKRYNIRNLTIYQDRDHLAFSQIAPAHPTYGVRATPTTVLVNPQGHYISAYSGVPGWEQPEGVRLLRWYMDNA